MGILSEQNMLANEVLADAVRPGSEMYAANYSFVAPMVYQMAEGTIINPQFMTPSSYSFDKTMGAITKSDASGTYTGVDGERITFAEAATQYGPPAGNQLADSQGTNLTSAANVISGKAAPTESVTTPSSETQMESQRNKTVVPGTNVAVASGGETGGFNADHKYHDANKSDWQGDMAANDAAAAANSNDAPRDNSMPSSSSSKKAKKQAVDPRAEAFASSGAGSGETSEPARYSSADIQRLMGMGNSAPGAGTGSNSAADPGMEEFASSPQSAPKDPRAEYYR